MAVLQQRAGGGFKSSCIQTRLVLRLSFWIGGQQCYLIQTFSPFSSSSFKTLQIPYLAPSLPPPSSFSSHLCLQYHPSPADNVNSPTARVGKSCQPHNFFIQTYISHIYVCACNFFVIFFFYGSNNFSNSDASKAQEADKCKSKELTGDPCGCCKVRYF